MKNREPMPGDMIFSMLFGGIVLLIAVVDTKRFWLGPRGIQSGKMEHRQVGKQKFVHQQDFETFLNDYIDGETQELLGISVSDWSDMVRA